MVEFQEHLFVYSQAPLVFGDPTLVQLLVAGFPHYGPRGVAPDKQSLARSFAGAVSLAQEVFELYANTFSQEVFELHSFLYN